MSEFELKWRDVESHLCNRCGDFMYEPERWVCCQCDEHDPDPSPPEMIWLWLYGGLVPCGLCGDLYQSDDDPDYEGVYCVPCRSVIR